MITLLVGCGSTSDKDSDKLSVLLMLEHTGDFSFNDSALEGIKRVEQDFGDKVEVEVIEYGLKPEQEEAAFYQAAETDYDIVIFSSGVDIYLNESSSDYDDKNFIIFDNSVDYTDGKNKNVFSLKYKPNEGSFLGGYMAAKMSDTGVIGFIGGQDVPIISDFMVGYIQGALYANPDIKIATSYVGAWDDSATAKEQALAMYSQDVSLIFGAAGGSGAGVIEAAADRSKLVLGVDSDQASVYEAQGKMEHAQVIATSVVKNIGESLYQAIDAHLQGNLEFGTLNTLGLEEGVIGLADNKFYQQLVSEDIRKELVELEAKVASGEIIVKSVNDFTPEEITEFKNSVKP